MPQQRRVTVAWPVAILAALVVLTVSCGQDLPEPESRGATLYVRYCSGKGCHDPIPPGRAGRRYWDQEFERMLAYMRKQSHPLPSAEEEREIVDYLHRHARGAEKGE